MPIPLPSPTHYTEVLIIGAGAAGLLAARELAAAGRRVLLVEAQARLVFENLGRALAAQGAGWADVVKLSYYVTHTDEIALVRSVRDEFVVTDRPPTSTLVQVAGLFRSDLVIEIEAVAWLP